VEQIIPSQSAAVEPYKQVKEQVEVAVRLLHFQQLTHQAAVAVVETTLLAFLAVQVEQVLNLQWLAVVVMLAHIHRLKVTRVEQAEPTQIQSWAQVAAAVEPLVVMELLDNLTARQVESV
jgi:hypothetical protein